MGTPLASSSSNQTSQQNTVMKRKLTLTEDNDETIQSNPEENNPLDSDSGLSEVPSQLGSPSLTIPVKPTKKKNNRMSVTAFTQALSQEPQHSLQGVYISLVDESSGIPSVLDSPDEVLFRKPGRPKKRTSISAFKEALQ